eukprot:9503804-Pyramimonas_sp.AAC.2
MKWLHANADTWAFGGAPPYGPYALWPYGATKRARGGRKWLTGSEARGRGRRRKGREEGKRGEGANAGGCGCGPASAQASWLLSCKAETRAGLLTWLTSIWAARTARMLGPKRLSR